MSFETNETNPRGTRTEPQPTRWEVWGKRLLRTIFWIVWLIDKGFRLISWISGDPPS